VTLTRALNVLWWVLCVGAPLLLFLLLIGAIS
jgi:hypothetical protein